MNRYTRVRARKSVFLDFAGDEIHYLGGRNSHIGDKKLHLAGRVSRRAGSCVVVCRLLRCRRAMVVSSHVKRHRKRQGHLPTHCRRPHARQRKIGNGGRRRRPEERERAISKRRSATTAAPKHDCLIFRFLPPACRAHTNTMW